VSEHFLFKKKYAYKKKQHKPPGKKKKRGKNLSPRNRKACHSISTALLQGIAEHFIFETVAERRRTLRLLMYSVGRH
jgi:hypothetical protein